MRVLVTQMGQSWVRRTSPKGKPLPGVWHQPGEIIDVPESKFSKEWMKKLDGSSGAAPVSMTTVTAPAEATLSVEPVTQTPLKRGHPRKQV